MQVEWSPSRRVPVDVVGEGGPVLLLAPGAGTSRRHLASLAGRLAVRGVTVATFDYPYRAEGRRAPDRAATLLAAHRAVAEAVAASTGSRPVLGGRSMGGRMATVLAADGFPTPGVVCLAYPLHPAGRPDRLRVEHLPRVGVPMLFVRGGRDRLATQPWFDYHVRRLETVTVVDIPDADHSLRSPTMAPDRVEGLLAERIADWMMRLCR